MKTNILIRPAARGGKYLGPDAASNNQSTLVYLTDASTGKLVTAGLVNTLGKDAGPANPPPDNLMAPVSRAAPYLTDATTVSVQLQVDIDVPTTFKVHVFGPLSHLDQARLAMAEITVLPGVDIGSSSNPEGLVIEVPGLCISGVTAVLEGCTVKCDATVTMMCGCKISSAAGSFWPPAYFSVQLVTVMASGSIYTYDLSFYPADNATSSFEGVWPNQASPTDTVREAWLYASEPSLGNQGIYPIEPPTAPAFPPDIAEALARAGAQI